MGQTEVLVGKEKTMTVKEIVEGKHFLTENFDELGDIVAQLRGSGWKIALTQGVYDMLHIGHARYLAEARATADVLIVGVDSDELTRQMKGPNRPYDEFPDRSELLLHLASVNIIARRDLGQDKYDLIRLVKPDVLVMSKTTDTFTQVDMENLQPFCGEIRHLEAKAATTTTARILRIKHEEGENLNGLGTEIDALVGHLGDGVKSLIRDRVAALTLGGKK